MPPPGTAAPPTATARHAPDRAIVVGMEKPVPPEAAPTNPGVQTARQLADPIVEMLKAWLPRAILQSANGLPVEELNIGAAIEAAIAARDRQHEAALEAERAVTEGIREDIAAFLLDRADQYDADRWEWHPLADAAKAIMGGDFDAAVDHGELQETELRRRVRNLGKK